jgi:hypothetical protein
MKTHVCTHSENMPCALLLILLSAFVCGRSELHSFIVGKYRRIVTDLITKYKLILVGCEYTGIIRE